jgi:hypothetical protein
MLIETGVVDDRGEQLDDVRPALSTVMDGDRQPARVTPARPAVNDVGDDLIRVGEPPVCCQRRGVGEVEIVGIGGAEFQIQAGVVEETQRPRRQFGLALQQSGGGHRTRHRFEHRGRRVAGGSQPGPDVALLVGNAGESREPGSGGDQVGRTLPVVNRDTERPAAGGEPADDVSIQPDRSRARRNRPDVSVYHALYPPQVLLALPNFAEVSIA